jgi:hypothetical protein
MNNMNKKADMDIGMKTIVVIIITIVMLAVIGVILYGIMKNPVLP